MADDKGEIERLGVKRTKRFKPAKPGGPQTLDSPPPLPPPPPPPPPQDEEPIG